MKNVILAVTTLVAMGLALPAIAQSDEVGLLQAVQKLVAADGGAFDYFGFSVAIDGDTALVGAYEATVNGNLQQGAAYIYLRMGDIWIKQAKLLAADGNRFHRFGASVALDGDIALIGAPYAGLGDVPIQGAAYVFVRKGDSWSELARLRVEDGEPFSGFGNSVAVDGDTALVGAPEARIDGAAVGAAFVFAFDGEQWTRQAKLEGVADGGWNHSFGISVALDRDTALVGAPGTRVGENQAQGAVYVYTRSGALWTRQAKLLASDGESLDRFGVTVALSDSTALVGTSLVDYDDRVSRQRGAYVFNRVGELWQQEGKLVVDDGEDFDISLISVAVDDNTALVGLWELDRFTSLPIGGAYLFTRTEDDWFKQARLDSADLFAANELGFSVALSGVTAIAGAPLVTIDDKTFQGAAYIFEFEPTNDANAALACEGADIGHFMPPMDTEVMVRGPNRVLPLRMQLFDEDGFEVTGEDLDAAPVLEVVFLGENSGGAGIPDELDYAGQGDAGNRFSYGDEYWHFNLGTGRFTTPGLYGITVEAGDSSYTIDPGCTASFVIR